MDSIFLFVSVVALTFLSGFQSKNVIGNHYLLAFLTSIMIGVVGLFLYRVMPTAGVAQMVAYVLAGPIGIILSMLVHNRLVKMKICQSNVCSECHQVIKNGPQA